MDIATILGTLLGLSIVLWAILMGSSLLLFINIPSILITIGGMLCATMIHFSLPQFLGMFSVIKKTVVTRLPSKADIIQKMVNFATINRRDGTLALEPEISKLDNPFLVKGMQLLVDGRDADGIKEILVPEIQYLGERHAIGKRILDFMGAMAPAFGMVGTLIGLIQMLANMTSPETIGSGMAVALLTTFYGSLASNLIFQPLAGKLSLYSKEESLVMEMILEGICAIANGDNPTIVREKLQAFISHSQRAEVKATV